MSWIQLWLQHAFPLSLITGCSRLSSLAVQFARKQLMYCLIALSGLQPLFSPLNGHVQGSSEESLAEAAKNRNARPRLEVDVPDPATLIDAFPHCKRLLDTFRASPNTQNKTPLAILHEYATRFTLEVSPSLSLRFICMPATRAWVDL